MGAQQEAADGRADHGANLEQAGVPGHGIAEEGGGDQLRQEGRPGRGTECLCDGGHKDGGVEPMDRRFAVDEGG